MTQWLFSSDLYGIIYSIRIIKHVDLCNQGRSSELVPAALRAGGAEGRFAFTRVRFSPLEICLLSFAWQHTCTDLRVSTSEILNFVQHSKTLARSSYEEVADKVVTSCKSTISKSSKMLKNQGFSNVQSNISQWPGKIFQKFQKILRDHGLKRPFLPLSVPFRYTWNFCHVFTMNARCAKRKFFKYQEIFIFWWQKFRVFFFGIETAIFERFGASAFQNTKNYWLTPKTRKDRPLWIRCGCTGNRRVHLLKEDFEAKFGPVKIGCMRTSTCSENLENHAIPL